MFPRLLSVIAFVIFFTTNQSAAEVIDDARQDFINGDYSKALAVIEPAARAGNALAQNLMGAAYNEGRGVEQNTGTSIEWFLKSTSQGNAKAQYNLGGLYLLGDATGEPDYRKAIEYLEMAMAQDYPPAFMIRGRMIRFGFGQGPDPTAATALFQRALDLGNGAAGNDLAEMYRTGEGVGVDETKAREYYRQAAATGYALAIGNLGVMHQYGIGGPRDVVAAYALLVEAAALGDPSGQINLAEFVAEVPGYWGEDIGREWSYILCLGALQDAEPDKADGYSERCEVLAENLTLVEKTKAHEAVTEKETR